MNLQLKGIGELSQAEIEEINSIIESSYEKIKRKLKTDFSMKMVVKTHMKSGDKIDKNKKYSIHAELFGARGFEARSEDWDLAKAVHMIVNKLEQEIEHKFHSSEQGKR